VAPIPTDRGWFNSTPHLIATGAVFGANLVSFAVLMLGSIGIKPSARTPMRVVILSAALVSPAPLLFGFGVQGLLLFASLPIITLAVVLKG
jgi:hypothetical protein